jgi:hypothetical protein
MDGPCRAGQGFILAWVSSCPAHFSLYGIHLKEIVTDYVHSYYTLTGDTLFRDALHCYFV